MRPAIRCLCALLFLGTPVVSFGAPGASDDFEQDPPGRCPAGWVDGSAPESRTRIEVTRSGAAVGRQCVRIEKAGDAGLANLVRSFDVAPHAGQRVRLEAHVRTAGPGCHAQLWLRIDRKGGGIAFLDSMEDRPIRSQRWARYAISARVPEDATAIWAGLIVKGTGRAWLDDVSLAPLPAGENPALEGVAVVEVKDFLRIENPGGALERLEFPRYFPAVDDEQIVAGRWLEARTDGGDPVPIVIAGVAPDPQGNLIHTFRIERFPAATGVVVTVTSRVLRRERPAPRGHFEIPAPSAYPAAVRPFLRSTPAVVVDHADIRAAAERILGRTKDAYEVAAAVAQRMRSSSYEQQGRPDPALPTSVAVLRHGGSCCGSAVCAAAILRACGIPAQLTYCPRGTIHGVVRFYLVGYGWCRMDATSGVGRLPLVEERRDRGLVRLYDMPIEMEEHRHAYAWPYQRETLAGPYEFRSDGRVVKTVRFAARDQAAAWREGRVAGRVREPFPHLEPGSWHRILSIEPWETDGQVWRDLCAASRRAVQDGRTGAFGDIRLPR